ncbi:MAG TPA: hypothetical protein VGN95_24670 [Pyrinomonadaceae bacterium]|jgi:hypothetical protein|nr:hypothetical protein [Pyrinomonadaceae bacterium]
MNIDIHRKTVKRIDSIVGNQPLSEAIYKSIASALGNTWVHVTGDKFVWDIFKRSLDAAIRDIEEHPRGLLFRRLIKYGPQSPNDPQSPAGDERTRLSYPECGSCVDFIYSHMVSRFKGEVAELLAIEPCIRLIKELQQERKVISDAHLYWGDMVQERGKARLVNGKNSSRWGSFTKGADGLLIERGTKQSNMLNVRGAIEVKSMPRAKSRMINQINEHIMRLKGGVKLGEREWPPEHINASSLVRIMVVPSTWKLSREWRSEKTKKGIRIVLPEPSIPSVETQVRELECNVWKITLAWSKEALNQAAFQMTFWYMSQVGRRIFTKKNMPETWRYMTPEEAGNNAIKQMLFFITDSESRISKSQMGLAAKLYNIYAYGYPLGIDARKIATEGQEKLRPGEILWPSDIVGEDEKRVKAIICVDKV